MLKCPQCNKALATLSRRCPSCQADLDLLVDYLDNLQEGLYRAEQKTRAGQLGEAVWAYLAVLEVEPDNQEAARQVGQVAAAVRQFDRSAPGRRWLTRLHQGSFFLDEDGLLSPWVKLFLLLLLVVGAFALGFLWGQGGVGE
jgi:hypothetical protein